MALLYFVTHPEVVVDPAVPVPRWGLSDVGRKRAHCFAAHPFLGAVLRVVSSLETKATETAQIIAGPAGLTVETIADFGEHDRSATGYVGGRQFDELVTQFFARPDESVRGWTPARTEQTRIVRALDTVLDQPSDGNIVVVSHGGVGTLLLCALNSWPIDRRRDQPGQGHWFVLDTVERRPLCGWTSLESAMPAGL